MSGLVFQAADWIEQGHALKAAGRLDKSVAAYRRALEQQPDHADGWRFLGNAYYNAGRLNLAREAYEACARLAPSMTKVWLNLGNTYDCLGLQDLAIESFESAVRTAPEDGGAWAHLAEAAVRTRRPETIERALTRLKELNPTEAERISTVFADSIPARKS